uniref:RH2 domain-containing protein n=1 Tax=Macrostomum lignano TaxID=282301 RepID=A0A1I8IL39_9PLAT
MPLVVGALESLESSLASQSNFQAELGLLRAESASQLEREIRARRQVEALLAAAEEAASEEREAWRRTSASKLQSTKERLTARINYADRDNESLLRQLCQAEESIVKFQTQLSSETATADSSAQTDDTVECGNHPAVTQVEVTRLLMERNAYKERLIELQEAVKKADCMRAAARLDQMRRRNDEDAQAKVSSRGRQRQRGRRQQEKPQLESGGRVTAAVRNLFGGLWSSLTTGPAQPVLGTPVDLNRPMLLD